MTVTKTTREHLEELVHRYADAVGHRDADQWISTWDENAKWVLGPGRDVQGREDILALWKRAIGNFSSVVQNVLNGSVDVDENAGTASGRWYIMEHFRRSNGEPGMLLAYYNDTYVRVGSHWAFATRELVRHYQGAPDLSGEFFFVF
jgi:SnoaL-like domain